MARKPSPAARTSVYRLLGVPDLLSAIQKKYRERDEFIMTSTKVGDREALLVTGAMSTEKVSWAGTLFQLTGEAVPLGNMTAAGVLLIRERASVVEDMEADGDGESEPLVDERAGDDGQSQEAAAVSVEGSRSNGEDATEEGGTEEGEPDAAWALTYGMGFQLLDQGKVDGGFGQRIAIRTADPHELNSLTRTTLDHRSRTDRFNIPSGDHLRVFGVGDYGEVVTRLVAKAEMKDLTAGGKPIRIRGADALSIPLGRSPEQLLGDLDVLASLLEQAPAAELAMLEQLVAVRNKPELVEKLEEDLEGALADPEKALRLGLSWPHERIEENSPPTSFKLFGTGRAASRKVQDGVPELDTLLKALEKVKLGDRLDALKAMKVLLFRDTEGTEAISAAIPALHWLAFETDREGKRYCLHDGRWYLMDQDYAEKLQSRTREIFSRTPAFSFPDWAVGDAESDYNQNLADHLGGVFLDAKLIHTVFHRRGIEACDVLAPGGELIHVKDLKKSGPASHLLAQALVSTDALLHDGEAREKLRTLVATEHGDPGSVPEKVHTVVLGLARKDEPLSADSLFTFTQVTLARQVAVLEAQGVDVLIGTIRRL